MSTSTAFPRAVRCALLTSAAAAAATLYVHDVHAAEEPEIIQEVVVTGSRIGQNVNLISSSPVTQINAEQLALTGITRVEDVLKDLPQVYQSQGTGQSNGATGTATINLRNLGDQRTLVLVNGRRLPVGSPIQGGDGADINQIPGALIERVEVLTGGASSTYGSDAVAGVVNFIMVDDFEGIKLDYQLAGYRHKNDNEKMRGLISGRGFVVPSGTGTDGNINDVSLIIGGNLNEGRGNVTAYATYRDVKAVTQGGRDYSGCSLNSAITNCAGSATMPTGLFSDFDQDFFTVQGDQFVEWDGSLYNFGPLNYWQRPDQRFTAGALTRYEVNEHVQTFGQLMFMDDRTVSQIAPSGNFFVTDSISCANPFLSAQQFQVLCADEGLTVNDVREGFFIGRRNVEGGPRQQDLRHTSYRAVFGVRGDFADTWRYDVAGQYSEVSMENTYLNDLSTTRIIRALDAVADPVTGQPTCQSVIDGSDPSCVPWNIFQTGGVTPEMIDYLVLPLFARGTTDQTVFTAYVAADLGKYGLQVPSAATGLEIVFGGEYRKENLEFNPDQGFQSGDGAGQGGATIPVAGGYDVTEWFMEARIPFVEDAPFARALALDTGYRYSDYSTGQTADTYKAALSWSVTDDIKFRGSFQRAIRAANLRELFQPQGLNLFDMDSDPCGGAIDPATGLVESGRTLEECARTGVTAAQYGSIPHSPAGQYNFLQGGNVNLDPEESDTVSFGFVFSPTFVEGLTVTVDYYDIDVTKAIDNLDSEFVLNRCLDTGGAQFCDAVVRGTAGSLWIGTAGFVVGTNVNTGFFAVTGYDAQVDYRLNVGRLGDLAFSSVATFIDSWEEQQVQGEPVEDCEGNWGRVCGFPTPKFRNQLRITWHTPWNVTASLNWRHIGSVDDLSASQVHLGARDYVDLAGTWEPTEWATVRLGINNVFDKEPPLAGNNAGPSINGNGNSFPGLYDALGQYLFGGLTLQF